jgi:hypothetical protein
MSELFHNPSEPEGLSPEAGLSGREARLARYDAMTKEGAHGGTQGSPMIFFLDV